MSTTINPFTTPFNTTPFGIPFNGFGGSFNAFGGLPFNPGLSNWNYPVNTPFNGWNNNWANTWNSGWNTVGGFSNPNWFGLNASNWNTPSNFGFNTPFSGLFNTGFGGVPSGNWNTSGWNNAFNTPYGFNTAYGFNSPFGLNNIPFGYGFNTPVWGGFPGAFAGIGNTVGAPAYTGFNLPFIGGFNGINGFNGGVNVPFNTGFGGLPFNPSFPFANWFGNFVPNYGLNSQPQNTTGENTPAGVPVYGPFGFVCPGNIAPQTKAA